MVAAATATVVVGFFMVLAAGDVVIIMAVVGLLFGRRARKLRVPRALLRRVTVAAGKVAVGARRWRGQPLNIRTQ